MPFPLWCFLVEQGLANIDHFLSIELWNLNINIWGKGWVLNIKHSIFSSKQISSNFEIFFSFFDFINQLFSFTIQNYSQSVSLNHLITLSWWHEMSQNIIAGLISKKYSLVLKNKKIFNKLLCKNLHPFV